MSILKSIFGRKSAKEQVKTDNEVGKDVEQELKAETPVTEPEIAKIQEVLDSVTLDPDFTISTDHPIPDNGVLVNEPVIEALPVAETVEVDTAESCKDVGCQCQHGHNHDQESGGHTYAAKIETIPLGKDELESLQNSHYEEIKDRFTKTFVIEKHFWAFAASMDPTKPGRTPVKVKRVAEIKAASLMNALNMLGWDTKNTTLVDTKDEFKNEVEISVDGCPVSRVALPEGFDKFETLGCGARKLLVYGLKDKAVADESVQKLIKEKMLVVSGWAYQPRQRINLVTSVDKLAREAAKAKKNSKSPVELVVADKPVDAVVEAPTVEATGNCKSSCTEDAPSKCVEFDSPEAGKAAMLNAIVDGCERSAKQVESILK